MRCGASVDLKDEAFEQEDIVREPAAYIRHGDDRSSDASTEQSAAGCLWPILGFVGFLLAIVWFGSLDEAPQLLLGLLVLGGVLAAAIGGD